MSIATDEAKSLHQRQASAIAPWKLSAAPAVGGWYPPIKFAIEWLGALVLLLIASPVAVLLAIVVKLSSPGPIFYAQTRMGRNSRVFRMYKLRSMVHNAEGRTGPVWATVKDSRITSVGRILRSTHLDEIPQLFNVLRGEMSLIGPRPERPELAALISRKIPEFRQRLAVRPGISGLAQLILPPDDPHDTAMNCVRLKLAHDLRYIREMGLLMDLRIAMGTPCYFLCAAIDAVQSKLVRTYEIAEEAVLTPDMKEGHSNAVMAMETAR
jgi:lipopolysaccharide/colanic/teichoic acid biosynthesis glycosyltransferase